MFIDTRQMIRMKEILTKVWVKVHSIIKFTAIKQIESFI